MEQKLTLNDGTVLNPAHAILSNSILWVYIDAQITLAEAFELLNDPDKTNVIISDSYGTETEYMGFTDLFCITRENNGQVNAGLKKAVE